MDGDLGAIALEFEARKIALLVQDVNGTHGEWQKR